MSDLPNTANKEKWSWHDDNTDVKMEKDEGSHFIWYSGIPKFESKNFEDINQLSGIFSVFLSILQGAIKIINYIKL